MKYFLAFLLSLSITLFAQVAVTENEPSALVEGIVSAITGDLYALEDDIIIQGVEPLRLRRSYISAKGEGNWSFFENLTATLLPPARILIVNEPNGTCLTYHYDVKEVKDKKKKNKKKKQEKHFHPLNLNQDAQGLTNTARGKISAHTNLKNQYVTMSHDGETFIVICLNGTQRNVTTTTYDDRVHAQTVVDPLGLQLTTHFNSHYLASSLEKLSCKNELLLSEQNTYDANDNLIGKETTLFHPRRCITTLWDYGPLDRLKALTEAYRTAEQKVTQYTYTPTGKLFQTIKPSGVVLTNTYDPLDYIASQSGSDGTVNYTYFHNRLGHLLQSVNELDKSMVVRTYDAKGRLLTEKLPSSFSVGNSYDLQGRRVRLDLPDGSSIRYDYDPLYLRKVFRYTASNDVVYAHTFTDYDLAGNLIAQEPIGNLETITRGYDLAGRPTSLISPYFSHEILKYDLVGNILQLTKI